MGAQRLDFDYFLMQFGHPFSSNFVTHPNLLNCNKHGVKTLLSPLLASHFGIENLLKFHVFSRHALGPHFSSFYMNLCQKARFWDPFKIQWGAKWRPKSAKWRQNVDKFLVGFVPPSDLVSDSRLSCRLKRMG
jgi:hypothetical protein